MDNRVVVLRLAFGCTALLVVGFAGCSCALVPSFLHSPSAPSSRRSVPVFFYVCRRGSRLARGVCRSQLHAASDVCVYILNQHGELTHWCGALSVYLVATPCSPLPSYPCMNHLAHGRPGGGAAVGVWLRCAACGGLCRMFVCSRSLLTPLSIRPSSRRSVPAFPHVCR